MKRVKVPLKRNRAGHLILEGKVLGKKLVFIVDSGASSTVFDNQVVEELGINVKESDKQGGGVGSSEMSIGKLPTIKIQLPACSIETKKAATIDLSHVRQSLKNHGSRDIHGIIGADVFWKYKTLIDYSNLLASFYVH